MTPWSSRNSHLRRIVVGNGSGSEELSRRRRRGASLLIVSDETVLSIDSDLSRKLHYEVRSTQFDN